MGGRLQDRLLRRSEAGLALAEHMQAAVQVLYNQAAGSSVPAEDILPAVHPDCQISFQAAGEYQQ